MRSNSGKEERRYGLKGVGRSQVTMAWKDKVETSTQHRKPLDRSHTPLISGVQLLGRLAAGGGWGRELHHW